MKRGRPKKLNKAVNRMHSVILDEEAEVIYRKICTIRGNSSWLHKYASEHIEKDFLPNVEESVLEFKILKCQEQICKLNKEIEKYKNRLNEVQHGKRNN